VGVLLAVIGLAATACAKSTTAGSGTSTTPTPTASISPAPVKLPGQVTNKGTEDLTGQGKSIDFSLEADDEEGGFYFKPTFIKATPGATVTVEVENEGNATHNFSITTLDVDQDVAMGEMKEVTFTLPASGVVTFFCKFHVNSGMQGAFFFTAGQTASSSSPSTGSSGYGY
jgi:plastocyanin